MTRTTTIAISSQKGGVAKTTTCFSLGASLAERGQSVLLIDMDPQANLTVSFGINPETLHHTIGDALLEQDSIVAVSREGAMPNLDIAPANQGLVVLDARLDFAAIPDHGRVIENPLYLVFAIPCYRLRVREVVMDHL